MLSQESSFIIRKMVSELQVRNKGCKLRCPIRWLETSSTHEPPEIHAHERTYNLAIIASNRDRPLSKGSVDDMRQMALKKIHNVKNSSEWSKFLRFYLYFCHAVLMNC